jgi:diaminopimelate epimerase
MSSIAFTKMHGIGNDYIYIDAHKQPIDDPAALARQMSDRHFGVGGDGIILMCPPSNGVKADVRMRMFNADGSESEMCGNGIRCVCKYAHDRGLSKANPMRIETGRGVLMLEYHTNGDGRVSEVTVDMGEPILEAARIPVVLAGQSGPVIDAPTAGVFEWPRTLGDQWVRECGLDERMTCVSTGNPHVILFVRDVQRVPLALVGPAIERGRIFPNRANVHFVQVHSPAEVTMRTWERGTGITLACGTGAAAVCVAGVLTGRSERKILAHLPGGDLRLRWDEKTNHIFKTGPATEVFEGTWDGPAAT